MVNPDDLGKRRRRAGLTLRQLGERIGVSGATISQWEHGVRPVPAARAALIDAVFGEAEGLTGCPICQATGAAPPPTLAHEGVLRLLVSPCPACAVAVARTMKLLGQERDGIELGPVTIGRRLVLAPG